MPPSIAVAESCPTTLRTELAQVVRRKTSEFTGWRWHSSGGAAAKPALSHRLAARGPQVVARQACGFHRLAAPRLALVRASSCGKAPRDPTCSVVGHRGYRRRSSAGAGALLNPSALLGLASNDSLQLTGGRRMARCARSYIVRPQLNSSVSRAADDALVLFALRVRHSVR
jgi:hypothetical protein